MEEPAPEQEGEVSVVFDVTDNTCYLCCDQCNFAVDADNCKALVIPTWVSEDPELSKDPLGVWKVIVKRAARVRYGENAVTAICVSSFAA